MRIEAVLLQTLSNIAEEANIIADRVKSASEVMNKRSVLVAPVIVTRDALILR